jgi:hypothetical protein
MRGGGRTREARVEGADDGKAIGRQTTQREEWGGGHNAGQLGGRWHGRGGGVDNARALVVDSFWWRQEGVHSRRPQNRTSKLYLKSCKTPLGKSGFPRRFLHNLRYDLMYNKLYLELSNPFPLTKIR